MDQENQQKPSLRPDQIQDLAKYLKNPKFLNLSDPGTGKTPSVCVYLQAMWEKMGIKTIWSMPKSLIKKNRDEILRFTNLTEEQVVILDGKKETLKKDEAVVFLCTFTRFALSWKDLKKAQPQLDAHIVDESHMGFKGAKSKRTEQLWLCGRKLSRFLAMSGTLIAGRLDNAFPVIKVIEPRYYANHQSFLLQHALMDEYGNVLGWYNHAKLGRILKKHGVRRTFESIFGSQKPVIQVEKAQMNPKQLKAYEELEATALLELEDSFIEAKTPAVEVMRCRQIMQTPEKFGILKKGELTGKDEILEVHLEDHLNTNKPLIIFSSFPDEHTRIAELCRKKGFRVGIINGKVPNKKRGEIDEAFRKGQLDIVIGSPATAAVGFNWQFNGKKEVDHVIFTALDYQDDNFSQAFKRAIRQERKKALRVTILEYENSIDQKIFAIVQKKSRDRKEVDSSYDELKFRGKKKDEEEDFFI